MADIVLINPRFDISYWGLEHAVPFLGAAKNVAEVVRGRDFIADRPRAVAVRPSPPAPRRPSPAR